MAAAAAAQPPTRRATTIAAIRAYPGFYHQQTVLVVGDVKGTEDRATIGAEEGAIRLVAREVPREGKIEARGQLIDIGRMSQDDPRLIPFNLLDRIRAAYQDRWPKPGEELILLLGGTAPAPVATDITSPPLRALAMEPARFDGQKVTITGQFRGRNLYGDLPEAPAQNRCQFVLRSADAAVWVMGLQPKGRTFNFDPSKRIDSDAVYQPLAARRPKMLSRAAASSRWNGCGSNSAAKALHPSSVSVTEPVANLRPTARSSR